MSEEWVPKNKTQAEAFKIGQSFVQGFTDQINGLKAENERLNQKLESRAAVSRLQDEREREKDAEIKRLRTRLEESYAKQTYKEWERNQKLISELADALHEYGFHGIMAPDPELYDIETELLDLIARARKAENTDNINL